MLSQCHFDFHFPGGDMIFKMYLLVICISSFDTCTPMLVAALFKLAKIWHQSRCPTIENWIKQCDLYTYAHIQRDVIQNKEEYNSVICKKMDEI
jgi:hypothetical protein